MVTEPHRRARELRNNMTQPEVWLWGRLKRLHARGFSRSEMILRMKREEIGSYLGMKLETVSRTFSKFVEDGLMRSSDSMC